MSKTIVRPDGLAVIDERPTYPIRLRTERPGVPPQEREPIVGHDLTPRLIRVAAMLAERFQNPDVAAYNRSHGGGRHRGGAPHYLIPYPRYIVAPSTPKREQFWFSVGRALGAAYGCRGCPTDYELAVRRDIDAARASMRKASAAAKLDAMLGGRRKKLTEDDFPRSFTEDFAIAKATGSAS